MTKEDWKKQQGGTAIQPLLAGKTCMEPPLAGAARFARFWIYKERQSIIFFRRN